MTGHSIQEAAERAGVDPGYLDRLIGLGLLAADQGDGYTPADVRQVMMVKSLEDGGISLAGISAAVERGALSFDFLATPTFERLAALASETFGQVSERTGIPLELLMLIREAIGMAQPSADDLLRVDELAIVPFLQLQVDEGFRPLSAWATAGFAVRPTGLTGRSRLCAAMDTRRKCVTPQTAAA